jgi:hypothetical protein
LERRLFRLFDLNYGILNQVKPCSIDIFEILDDEMREAARLMNKIKML